MQIHYISLHAVSEQIRTQKISPVAVVEACLARIAKLNPSVNAFITVLAEEARLAAKQAEQEIEAGHWRGPLHGVPIAFKDMYDTAGIKTTAAFEHFKERVPQKDAAAVAKLEEAGAIVIGKTNMHTLAMGTTSAISAFGAVHNPWDTTYIAGGSSGGSAAAVASGMCYATIDTDAIGSTRLPAACCGVVGYKCTWGLIDNTGILEGEAADPVILKLATIGIMARETRDIALVADTLTGASSAAALNNETSQRIGVATNFGATPAVRKAFEGATKTFAAMGYSLSELAAPITEQPDMQKIDDKRKTSNDRIFANVDVLILPTLCAEVPTLKSVGSDPQALSPQNTFFANYEGLPAISIPCGVDKNGLPIGLQIVGKQNDDSTILQVANTYLQNSSQYVKHPA